MVILTLPILGFKHYGKLPWYLRLPPWANIIKHFIQVIYCHSMVFTAIIMFYNTGWQQYHGIAVNYHGKKFYNIGPKWQHGVPDMFWNFHLVKNHKIANNSATTETREKISTYFESLEFFYVMFYLIKKKQSKFTY